MSAARKEKSSLRALHFEKDAVLYTNAATEFMRHVAEVGVKVFAADFRLHVMKAAAAPDPMAPGIVELPTFPVQASGTLFPTFVGHELKRYMESLDFYYDSFLFGTIWFVDRSWSEHREKDGFEQWIHFKCPEVPRREAYQVAPRDSLAAEYANAGTVNHTV
jgi:hypothetical protein